MCWGHIAAAEPAREASRGRSMVEGYSARRSSLSKDMLNYAFEICEYVSRGNTKSPDIMCPQPIIPTLVMLGSTRTVVRLAVNLDS